MTEPADGQTLAEIAAEYAALAAWITDVVRGRLPTSLDDPCQWTSAGRLAAELSAAAEHL